MRKKTSTMAQVNGQLDPFGHLCDLYHDDMVVTKNINEMTVLEYLQQNEVNNEVFHWIQDEVDRVREVLNVNRVKIELQDKDV